jgi:hypothetical protein
MKPNHTPGPWFANDLNSKYDPDRTVYARTPIHGNPRYIARVYGQGAMNPDPESLANARLIAAAPALRAAVAGAFDFICSRHDDEDAEEDHLIALLDAALAAADKGAP